MFSVNKLFEFTEETQERKSVQSFLNKTNPEPNLNDNYKSKFNEITILCNNATAYESLVPLLKYIARNGNPGHSFDIVVDPDSSDSKRSFEFDGDGAHFNKQIKLNSVDINKIIKDEK
jgi:hypothetical protein